MLHLSKKIPHRFVRPVFFAALFAATLFSLPPLNSAVAQTTRLDELRQSISSREEDIKRIEDEIADYKNRLRNVGTQKRTLQTAVQALDLSRAKLGKDIELTQKKIERTDSTIRELNNDITKKEMTIEKNKRVIAEIIHRIDQADSDSMLEVLLSNKSISEFLLDIDDLGKLQQSIQDHIKSLSRLKNELSASRTIYQKEYKSLSGLRTQIADQKTIADQARKQQSSLLGATKNQESNYKKLLAGREKAKKQFEAEVDDFEAQLRAEIDPTSFPAPGSRIFVSPLEDIIVTQKFGKTVDSHRLYTSGTHNGTDFRAAPGTVVRSVSSGTITATGDTDKVCPGASYGRWVLVKHHNGLSTLYGHLELIKVRAGQSVDAGDTVGYSGNTGYSTGPHLHFTVYVSSAVEVVNFPSKSCKGAIFRMPVAPANGYLDPQDYL